MIIISLFPLQKTKAKTPLRPTTRTDDRTLTPAAPGRADRIGEWLPEEPVARTARQRLGCLWYSAAQADTLADVDEFLRTPAGTAALADFYRGLRGGPAPESDVRTLIDAVGVIAARMRA